MSVKHLTLVRKGSYIDKQLSLDEIRVWQTQLQNLSKKEHESFKEYS